MGVRIRELLFIRFWVRILCHFCLLAALLPLSDARKSVVVSEHISSPMKPNVKHSKILEMAKTLNMIMDVSLKDSSTPQPSVSSPFSLPPFDSLSPMPLPNTNYPPYCVYPPPQPPSTGSSPTPSGASPTPTGSSPTPPSGPNESPLSPPLSPQGTVPSPPSITPGPPSITPGPPESVPSPFVSVANPPPYYEPIPPYYEPSPPSGNVPSPPEYVPSPVGFAPSPPIFQPPVVYPLPTVPPSPSWGGDVGGTSKVWCVAKPSVPDPIIQEAMNYACGSGADCGPIQPNGSCYQPNTLIAHASYAFNSYWQGTRVAGGNCDFGGTAILVTVDPSSDGCRFINN